MTLSQDLAKITVSSKSKNIVLNFLDREIEPYKQFGNEFVPYLSIIDLLMFNDIETVQKMITKGKLV